jgi:3-deoxy-7-phosphoheptulonate synthase
VADMAAASVAAGADGLIVEMHPNPEKAMSDGYQSLDFNQFQEMMNRCSVIAKALGKTFG